ncbi:MAG: diguanylate cyclase [Gallionella sp.]|nr:diguanylate cyclase [Gallionella sp.]
MQDNPVESGTSRTYSILAPQNETRRLRLSFLVPLLIAIAFIVVAMVAINYSFHQRQLKSGVVQLRTSAARLYEESVQQNIRALHMVMDVLERDQELHSALARKDRSALLVHSEPLFDEMKRNYGITHFYFSGPDRVNLLRVHQPARHGDLIERLTMLNAERSGAVSAGIELGPLGLLTLRLVSPWRDARTHKLIGYVELGMEIDNILQNVQRMFGVEVLVLIQKQYLKRQSWEDGMRVMGRQPSWDQFHDVVVSVQGKGEFPESLAALYHDPAIKHSDSAVELDCNGHICEALPLALQDVGGNKVAEMVILADTSEQVSDAHRAVTAGTVASIVSGIALFAFFYLLVGRVGRRIEYDEQMLHDLATRDGLTRLYNHRMFYTMLEDEITRSQRYQRIIAMLLIDIDHFKRVNDTYGHVAGDRILEGVARVLESGARREDKVCRYGGEEIAVILPETNIKAATHLAERLRAAIEETTFHDDAGKEIRITVSIGVAELPSSAGSLQELVSAADTALYDAKQSGRNRVCNSKKTEAGKVGESASS